MLSVVLAKDGCIHWDWCTPWDVEKPNQKWITTLIANLNSWRRGAGNAFLRHGRMVKPFAISGAYDIPMTMFNGKLLPVPSLLTSRWLSNDGRDAQVVVNYTPDIQEFMFSPQINAEHENYSIVIHRDAAGKMYRFFRISFHLFAES